MATTKAAPVVSRADWVSAQRPAYQAELGRGEDRFWEPRRQTCAWCESSRLRELIRTTDVMQSKPGTFVLDECLDCRHIFQNPRLTPEGLDFYYRDFYDGDGAHPVGKLFTEGPSTARLRAGAESLLPHIKPRRWLDVGTAHGHFCAVAKEVFPDTVFDGLDCGDGVEEARRTGRIERAHQGFLPELAESLEGQYDVVSMNHVLEHTTDPRANLAAAHRVLRPGGHLLIDVPNPESPFARRFGRYWLSWFQPQHLHFVPLGNLRTALREAGFSVVATDHAGAHIRSDVVGALMFLVLRHLPYADEPWLPRSPRKFQTRVRKLLFNAAIPLFVLGIVADRLIEPFLRRTGKTNAYRVVARRD
ncbi:class I SAM-dependent methyltransferase [Streptomyces monticola]|uniref:Class I SAM-dependent methyltransferase n=1 Tax=Streptomyces monticola TaxID=2666263 RepID=A0ABW2JT57_9ACTN